MSSFDQTGNSFAVVAPAADSMADMAGMDMGGTTSTTMDHGDMDCGMAMYFNGHTRDFCVLFASWTITSDTALGIACLASFLISIGYELLKLVMRRIDATAYRRVQRQTKLTAKELELANNASTDGAKDNDDEAHHQHTSADGAHNYAHYAPYGGAGDSHRRIGWFEPIYFLRCFMYGIQVFYAFFLMLIIMTYNVYLIVSVCVGAMVGFYLFGREEITGYQTPTCH
ncbi:copper transpport protein [Dimargaris cristalligena]|nr:copper transpport protein [Dimargaris cristalligena]